MTKLITGFFATIIAVGISAAEDCPWIISNHFTRQELKKMDPSDQHAIGDLLSRIYHEPKIKLSAADRDWIKRYDIKDKTDLVRKAGRENDHKVQSLKRKRALLAGGALLTAPLGAGLLLVNDLMEKVEMEDYLNQTYNLHLSDNSKKELKMLERMLYCNPAGTIGDYHELKKLKEGTISKVRPLVEYLLFSLSMRREIADKFYQALVEFSHYTGNTVCTRFGHKSHYRVDETFARIFMEVYALIPSHLWSAIRNMEGIVLTHPDYGPRKNPELIKGVYVPRINRLVMYTSFYDPMFADVLVHELAHAISDYYGRERGYLAWNSLNFRFDLIDGWVPRKDKWFPSLYSRKNPEEFFAESFVCFLDSECRKRMEQKNPEVHAVLDKLVHP